MKEKNLPKLLLQSASLFPKCLLPTRFAGAVAKAYKLGGNEKKTGTFQLRKVPSQCVCEADEIETETQVESSSKPSTTVWPNLSLIFFFHQASYHFLIHSGYFFTSTWLSIYVHFYVP